MASKTVDIPEQRVRFAVAAAQGVQPFSFLFAELGISRPTGYLWLRRYKKWACAGLPSKSQTALQPAANRCPFRTARRAGAIALSGLARPEIAHSAVGSGHGSAPNTIHHILFMVWFERKTTARQRCNVLNESNPTSYGR